MSYEDRLRKIEEQIHKVKGAGLVLGALGIGLATYTTYVSNQIPDAAYVREKKEEIEKFARSYVSDDLFSSIYTDISFGAQIIAQASCSSLSPNIADKRGAYSVRAVYRRYIAGNGRDPFSDNARTCDEICQDTPGSYNPDGRASASKCFGGIHVYQRHPPLKSNMADDGTSAAGLGMITFGIKDGCTLKTFGPNYCCCESGT